MNSAQNWAAPHRYLVQDTRDEYISSHLEPWATKLNRLEAHKELNRMIFRGVRPLRWQIKVKGCLMSVGGKVETT